MNPPGVKVELADKARGIASGGVGLMVKLAREVRLVAAIDRRVQLLKMHVPYHESDHVLNFALNALCDATCLQDMERRRNGGFRRIRLRGGRRATEQHLLEAQRRLRRIRLRGDTAFSQTEHLDRWDAAGVRFPPRILETLPTAR